MITARCVQFDRLTFEDAVRLYKSWGFSVEPGPQPEDVTLIWAEPDHQTYCVCPACVLPEMAAVALRVRLMNGALYEALATPPPMGQEKTAVCSRPLYQ